MRATPFLLIVLDGWGYREDAPDNAITRANTPTWHHLWSEYPHTLLSASGLDVGLPEGQMGNSEVGHMHIGAGRTIYQDLTRIDKAIKDGEFQENPAFVELFATVKHTHSALHVMGLLSPGGVHSHEKHIQAFIEAAAKQGVNKIYVHIFLDGRDVPPKSATDSIAALEETLTRVGVGRIVSVMGRYYAMDRDKRWERTQLAFDAIVHGRAEYHAESASEALEQAYARGETDEFVKPTIIYANDSAPIILQANDGVMFMNFRADRARQLTRALCADNFVEFSRELPELADVVTLTEYAQDIPATVAFAKLQNHHVIGSVLAEQGLTQLRIAETEKYAHVTFFLNGGVETPFPKETRILVPSPRVATYDLQPEMSAVQLTDQLVEAITSGQYDAIFCNYANPDMVGHTGDFDATKKAIEMIDTCLGRVFAAIQEANGEMMITADHGNAEQLFDPITGQPHTAHTHEPVPCIYVGRKAHARVTSGTLADVAPTILYLMDLKIPTEMTGNVLFTTD